MSYKEPAPVKKASVKAKSRKQYGGPGTFIAHSSSRGSSESPGGSPQPAHGPIATNSSWSLKSSNTWKSALSETELQPETLPSSLRSSSSMAQIGLYRPSYEGIGTHSLQSSLSQGGASTFDSLTNELGQMALHEGVRRRLVFPVWVLCVDVQLELTALISK